MRHDKDAIYESLKIIKSFVEIGDTIYIRSFSDLNRYRVYIIVAPRKIVVDIRPELVDISKLVGIVCQFRMSGEEYDIMPGGPIIDRPQKIVSTLASILWPSAHEANQKFNNKPSLLRCVEI